MHSCRHGTGLLAVALHLDRDWSWSFYNLAYYANMNGCNVTYTHVYFYFYTVTVVAPKSNKIPVEHGRSACAITIAINGLTSASVKNWYLY